MDNFPVSSLRVALKTADLGQMLKLLKISWKLLNSPAYRQQIAADLPESARFCPGNAAVMMGYDFHLSDQGPRLIEINTNAGGAGLALRACRGEPSQPQACNDDSYRCSRANGRHFGPVAHCRQSQLLMSIHKSSGSIPK